MCYCKDSETQRTPHAWVGGGDVQTALGWLGRFLVPAREVILAEERARASVKEAGKKTGSPASLSG